MKAKLTDLQLLSIHAIETLPDSNAKRRKLLTSITAVLPDNDTVRHHARLMLKYMDAIDNEQAQLHLDFQS